VHIISRRNFSAALTVLFLLTAAPVFADDQRNFHTTSNEEQLVGGSRWCFGKDNIVGNIDFNILLLMEIKGIKEGHYDLNTISDEQLRQIADDILQPYITKRLSITVNDKPYPVKVNKIVNTGGIYTIWLFSNGVNFNNPVNHVRINYTLLFEETDNVHVNLAYGYLSDATGDELQKVFDFSRPVFLTTFDSRNQVWQLSIKGPANSPAAENITNPAANKEPAGLVQGAEKG
jgi:hypothetical protein